MSSSTTTPVILPEDLKFYLSGGYFNTDPVLSLGGEISSFQLVSGTLNGLFDRVDTSEAELGDIEYRCVYLRNTSQTRKLLGTKIWIETGTASADTSIAISIGSSGINGTEPRIPDEGIEPPMNFFEIPLQAPDEPNIGDLYPGDHVGLWVRWYVNPGTQSIADDFAVIRIDGEREAESLSQPLPNPTDPPPSTEGCPQGSKWSPIEMRCVDDATVIRCPNGYTYNSTTQRCVPPSTPPPSVPNWTFAAAGDFSCSGDADDTGALIGSKLNKTAGNDIGLLLALGDFSYEDGDESCWYDNMESNLGPTLYPDHIAPILGNHDDGEDGSSSDRTSVIAEFPLIPTTGYYAFTRRNIRFIMMDTQSSYGTSSQQFAFVKSELEKATADPAIMWKVVCYHKPSFTTGSYYGPLTDFRNAYHALFSQHKVSIVFNGHNHIYFRSKPVRFDAANPGTPIIASDLATGNYINVDGTIYCTSGAAGRSSHTEYDSTAENFVGFRHAPAPYGSVFVTLQDSGNQLRFQFITNANQILDDFTLSKPGATPPPTGEKVCPTGFNWDETLGRCVISPTQCPTNYRWEPAQNRCVAISGNPPPTGGDPLVGVLWYYDSTATQNSAQTITASSYDATEGIILSSNISSVANTVISGGYINVKAGTGGTGRIYFDYWKKSRWAQDDLPKFNLGMLISFVYEGQTSVTIRDGNSPTTGFSVPGKTLQFEGFGFTLTSNQIIADVNYYSTTLGETVSSVYPGSRTLVNGRTYKVFYTIRKDRVNNRIVLNVWMDFGDGTNTWLKIMTDRTWSSSNWNPGDAPTSTDETQIETGPYAIERHHVMVRNNGIGSPDLRIKDVKIGTLPYLSDVNNPPPGSGGNPGGGGGTGTGGTLDSRGIRWYAATGQQGVIAQTRDTADDDRWSGNITNVDQYGYEVTMIMQNFSGVASDGHFALKHWGPNHSAPCGYQEDGDCCCWYDTGIRANGDVQFQVERPHPSNTPGNNYFNVPFKFSNIGKGMNNNSIGLKWLVHPVTPGGDVDHGGIHLMMWVDTDPIGTDGKPKNGWRLAYDIVDTGQILGDYNPPSEHDCEVRNSGTNSRTPYGGGLHWRKLQAGDTVQWNTGGTGGGGGTTNPPPPPSGTAFKLISWGDNDTTQDAEDVLNMIMTESNVEQYLFAGDGPYSNSATEWISMMSSYFNTSVLKGKLMLAQGNHEHPESESQTAENQIEAWFPGLNNADDNLDWLQAKQVRNCYIIVMNSQDPQINTVGGDQYNWVQARLNDAVALRTAGTIDWIIMMVHKNWFSLSAFHVDAEQTRHVYKSMMNTAQVDFMFSGHTHTYQLFKPITARTDPNDETDQGSIASGTLNGSGQWNFALTHGVMQIVNGNGGHEINSFGEDPNSVSTILYANDDEFGYTVLEIDGKTARVITKSVGGNVRHTVTVVR